jgi:GT2 family glycosyltransferase
MSHKELPPVSVIIITYNRCRELERCLDSIMAQTYSNFETVIVDGGSTDCTFNVIKQYPIKFVQEFKRGGISAARNLGIFHSKGNIVVFLDDDAIAEIDWLENLVKPFENEKVAGASGKVIPIANSLLNREFAPDYDQGADVKETKYFVGCNMAFRKSAVIEVGLFDPKIKYGHDENELCSRLLEAGYRLIYTPYAVAHHNYVTSFSALLKKKFKLGKSHVYVEKKLGHHPSLITKKRIVYLISFPLLFLMFVFLGLSYIFWGLYPYFLGIAFLIGCYFILLGLIIKNRTEKSLLGVLLTIPLEFVRECGWILGWLTL